MISQSQDAVHSNSDEDKQPPEDMSQDSCSTDLSESKAALPPADMRPPNKSPILSALPEDEDDGFDDWQLASVNSAPQGEILSVESTAEAGHVEEPKPAQSAEPSSPEPLFPSLREQIGGSTDIPIVNSEIDVILSDSLSESARESEVFPSASSSDREVYAATIRACRIDSAASAEENSRTVESNLNSLLELIANGTVASPRPVATALSSLIVGLSLQKSSQSGRETSEYRSASEELAAVQRELLEAKESVAVYEVRLGVLRSRLERMFSEDQEDVPTSVRLYFVCVHLQYLSIIFYTIMLLWRRSSEIWSQMLLTASSQKDQFPSSGYLQMNYLMCGGAAVMIANRQEVCHYKRL